MSSKKKYNLLTINSPLTEDLVSLTKHFKSHGYSLYAVGGCMRDMFIGETIKDIDCTTNASPKQMMTICKQTFPTGIQHGTLTILWTEKKRKPSSFEVTTHRTETTYTNFRHPDKVNFGANLEDDLKRRDFTINAIAFNPLSHEYYDPFGGKQDIKNKIIRCVGDAKMRFTEDALRILRAIRFCASLDFTIEQKTYAALCGCAANIVHISQERISAELQKMLTSNYPNKAFNLLYQSKIYTYIFSSNMVAQLQKNHKNVSAALTNVKIFFNSDNKAKNRLIRISPDIYKNTKQIITYTILCIPMENPLPIFPLHTEALSAKNAFIQLKLPNNIIRAIHNLLTHIHIYPYKAIAYNKSISEKRMRILITLLGCDFALLHLILHISLHNIIGTDIRVLQNCYNILLNFKEQKCIENTKDLQIDGTILCEIKNKKPGKWLGDFQKSLMRFAVLHPNKNSREDLTQYAKKLHLKKN